MSCVWVCELCAVVRRYHWRKLVDNFTKYCRWCFGPSGLSTDPVQQGGEPRHVDGGVPGERGGPTRGRFCRARRHGRVCQHQRRGAGSHHGCSYQERWSIFLWRFVFNVAVLSTLIFLSYWKDKCKNPHIGRKTPSLAWPSVIFLLETYKM